MILGLSAVGAGGGPALAATAPKSLFLYSNRAPDISPRACAARHGCGPSVEAPVALAAGERYLIRVSGTISVWDVWSSPVCGIPEPRPRYLTPGTPVTPTGDDAVFRFAVHRVNDDCRTLPLRAGLFQINLGSRWFVPPALGNPKVPSGNINGDQHPYWFAVTGEGHPPRFRYVDFHPSDNDGAFKITILTAPPPGP